MAIFKKAAKSPHIYALQTGRSANSPAIELGTRINSLENRLYEQLRIQVPVIDACISKIIRLTGT